MVSVLVIREDDQFSELLREAGLGVLNLPLTRTEPLDDLTDLGNTITNIDEYDGLFFTSPAAAEVFVREIGDREVRCKVYVLGGRAAKVLSDAGIAVQTHSEANTADELLDAFGDDEFRGQRYLFVRGERSMRTIPDRLRKIAEVDEVAVYRTVDTGVDGIPATAIDWICFFSPSGAEAFDRKKHAASIGHLKAAAIGTTTAKAAEALGFDVGFVSRKSNAVDFAQGLIGHIKNIE